MSEFMEPNADSVAATPRWVGLAIAVLGGISLIGVGLGFAAWNTSKSLEQSTQASLKQNDALTQRLAKSEEQNQQLQSDLKVVTDKLNVTQEDLQKARQQSKASVAAYDKKLNGLQSNVNTQLAGKANTEDVNKLGTDVSGVKNDLDETKSKLERATGDMGVMSGLIARNHDDLEELKRKGDRNYFEFTIQKSKAAQHVGPVAVSLGKTDPKRSKYTITGSVLREGHRSLFSLRARCVRRDQEPDYRLSFHAEVWRCGDVRQQHARCPLICRPVGFLESRREREERIFPFAFSDLSTFLSGKRIALDTFSAL